jgi:hypothetical protein
LFRFVLFREFFGLLQFLVVRFVIVRLLRFLVRLLRFLV